MNTASLIKKVFAGVAAFITPAASFAAVLLFQLTLGAGHASAACSTLPASLGTVSMTVNVSAAGTYRVWVRELAPSTTTSGFYLQIPDAGICQDTMGNAAIPANTWTWVDYQNANTSSVINATLTSGNHGVVLAGLNSGTEVDKLELLTDTTCTPTGDGTNCTAAASSTPAPGGGSPTPVPVSIFSNPSSPTTVSKSISIPIPAGATDAKCYVDNKLANCADIDTTDLSDGKHTIELTAIGANGKPIVKITTVKVKNHDTPAQALAASAQRFRTPIIVFIVLLVAAAVGWYAYVRFDLQARWRTMMDPAHSSPADNDDAPPPADVVYPDKHKKD